MITKSYTLPQQTMMFHYSIMEETGLAMKHIFEDFGIDSTIASKIEKEWKIEVDKTKLLQLHDRIPIKNLRPAPKMMYLPCLTHNPKPGCLNPMNIKNEHSNFIPSLNHFSSNLNQIPQNVIIRHPNMSKEYVFYHPKLNSKYLVKNKVDADKILGKAEHESSKKSKHEIEERNLMLKALKSESIYTNDGS